MTEIAELLSPPGVHTEPDDECPFCPKDDPEEFKSHYKGEDNDSTALGNNLDTPGKLTSGKFSQVRPKDGGESRQARSNPRPKPSPIWSCAEKVKVKKADPPTGTNAVYREIGDYSCQAHHLIAGNDAMKGSAMELWISSDKGKISKDTGYSINNVENGDWFPSQPENSKVTKANKAVPEFVKWGDVEPETRQEIAFKVMEANKGQFHMGGHNIDDGKHYHKTYTEEVPRLLKDLSDLIHDWASGCFLCDDIDPENGPFDPNWKVHNMLDRLSGAIDTDLKYRSPCEWDYFLSTLAAEYHNQRSGCPHACRAI